MTPINYITVFDDDEGLVRAMAGGELIGRLLFHVNHCYFPERTLYPDELSVRDGYRRRGIATELNARALATNPDLPMTYSTEAVSADALMALPAFARAHPGRLKLWDDSRGIYVPIESAPMLIAELHPQA